MARVAGADVPVHIFGETGTGKEKVARALHRQSPRRGRPFVAVNASSLSDELFEAELFGHVRGAFTGAVADREGYVAAAEGGTLLIDEVADLSSRGQAKLLRFLTDGEYRRLGEAAPRRSNVRILTAANVELRARVTAGRFREDLLFRLAGAFTLVVPPLRDRGDDLELLCRHFLEQAARRHRLTPPRLPSDVALALRSYPWPGNVRELESEMQRLVVLSAGGPIRRDHVSPHVAQASAAPGPSELRASQRAWERDHIRSVLERHRGNRTRAAHALGITRQGLLEKLRRLGL
jgi:two-component system response regulator HupR/HoxA